MNFSKIENVREWLKDLLSQGPILASEVYEESEEIGISKRTLDRAKADLRIKSQESPNKDWWWYDPLVSMDEYKLDEWYRKNSDWLKNNLNDLETSEDYKEFRLILEKDDETSEYNDNPYEWLEQNNIYYHGEAKKEIKSNEREAVLHKKAFKEEYGYNAYPAYDYGIQPDKC